MAAEKKLRIRGHKVVLNRSAGGDTGITVILVFLGLFMFLPMYYVVVQSLKPLDELFMFPPRFYVIHPTFDNFTDLVTLMSEKGRLDNLTIGLCGDMKHGRTVHSLIEAMSRYEDVKFVLISPDELKVPGYIKQEVLDKNNIEYVETRSLEDAIPELDILYMTRVQRERFFNEDDYIRLKDTYILNMQKLVKAKDDLAILHPLPRVNEIAVEIDNDPRACYFEQALNGKYIRMALILKLLGVE